MLEEAPALSTGSSVHLLCDGLPIRPELVEALLDGHSFDLGPSGLALQPAASILGKLGAEARKRTRTGVFDGKAKPKPRIVRVMVRLVSAE